MSIFTSTKCLNSNKTLNKISNDKTRFYETNCNGCGKLVLRKTRKIPTLPCPSRIKEKIRKTRLLIFVFTFFSNFLEKMTDHLSEIRTLNNITRRIFKTELTQFHGIIFAVLSSLCYRSDTTSSCWHRFSTFFLNHFTACAQ